MSIGGVPGVGVRPDQIVNQQEAQQHLAADGKTKLPDDAKAVTVKPGDTISEIMKENGLDWNNKAQREQFLKDNPQFSDQHPPLAGARSADLIYPGETVYVRDPAAAKGTSQQQASDKAVGDYKKAEEAYKNSGGSSSQYLSEQAQKAKDAMQKAFQAEIAAGGSADELIKRNGGINADRDVIVAARRAETDQAAADYKKAVDAYNKSGSPGAQTQMQEAKAKLDSAVKAEIKDSATLFANGSSREEVGKGAISAGNSIEERLKTAGISPTDAKAVVDHNAQQVQKDIENEQ